MDKILSYPLDLLEVRTQAESIGPVRPLTGRAPTHRASPVSGANSREFTGSSYWARAPTHWASPVSGANSREFMGPSYWARAPTHWASPVSGATCGGGPVLGPRMCGPNIWAFST